MRYNNFKDENTQNSDRGAAFKRVSPTKAAIAVGRSVKKVVPPKGLSVWQGMRLGVRSTAVQLSSCVMECYSDNIDRVRSKGNAGDKRAAEGLPAVKIPVLRMQRLIL